jgi:iron complex outermembrane receptor protein
MPPAQLPLRPCRPTRLGGWLSLLCALLWATLPAAEEAARRHYDIPAGSAVVTLKRAAHQGGLEIVYSAAVVEGVQTQPVAGEFTPREALERMVAHTPLKLFPDPRTGALSILRAEDPEPRPPPTPPSPTEPPQSMKPKTLITVLSGWLALAGGSLPVTKAADGGPLATGTIEGRAFNLGNGDYVEKARITIEGTTLEAFTDSEGRYRVTSVPVGQVRLKAFFTGLATHTKVVPVAAGQVALHDIKFSTWPGRSTPGEGIVKLSGYVVTSSKQMDGAAIAINEQRFAPNFKNVLASDEFGVVPEGNVGEFLKFLPGVTMDYGGGDARTIAINGAPSNYVPVTIGGFNLASAASSGTGRSVELEGVSINNISRLEVYYTPTPESPGSALAGGVNLVPRSAFDRAKPVFNYSAFLMMRDDARDFRKTPGPLREPTRKVHPGFDFSYVAPVSKTFGFTLTGAHSQQFNNAPVSQMTWRGVGAATNGTTLPDTTPGNPYLTDYTVRDGTKTTWRDSVGLTIDYRLTERGRLSFSFQYAYYYFVLNNRTLNFLVNQVSPGNWGLKHTTGFAGAGEVRISQGAREKSGTTYMPTLTYRHSGPIWKGEAAAGYSRASNHYEDIGKGFFNNATARRTGVTVSYDDIYYLRPGKITVTDPVTGAVVNPSSLSSYVLTAANSDARRSADHKHTAFANAQRDFNARVPLTLKAGLDVRRAVRDIRGATIPFTFVGRDGLPSTTPRTGGDDGAAVVLDENFSQRTSPHGFPSIQWISNEGYWDLSKANPTYFTSDQNAAYVNSVNLSKRAEELVSAAYLRADTRLMGGRMKLVGGLRAEQTNLEAQGPLNDPTRNFRRDASGNVVFQRDANGVILRNAAGAPLPVLIQPTSNPLGVSSLTRIDRGLHAKKEYLRWFPSLNVSYNVRENLIARAGYYHSVGRPDFNQYAGGITLPDTENLPSPTNRITVNNAGIKAWSARSVKVQLEYYFEGVGLLSFGAYRRQIDNFFGGTVFPASPEFLSLYGLDAGLYGAFDVATQNNLPTTVRMEGYDVNYKQALTFLPHWARGIQIFANGSFQRTLGDNNLALSNSLSNAIPKGGSWGISLTRPAYNLRVNWNYRGISRVARLTGRSIEPETYRWISRRLYIDASGEYFLRKNFALFAGIRNLRDTTEDQQDFGPTSPAEAQFRLREQFDPLWTFGVKGSF